MAVGVRALARILAVTFLCCLWTSWVEAAQSRHLTAEIRAQALASALREWAHQAGAQLMYETRLAQGRSSSSVPRGMPALTALQHLLRGTGLRYEILNSRSVSIVAMATEPVRLVREGDSRPRDGELDEVTVYGEAITSSDWLPADQIMWTAEDLQDAAIRDLSDLAAQTPGVDFSTYVDQGAGYQTDLTVRGIDARDGSTVAVWLDGLPMTRDRASVFGKVQPLMFDMQNVNVLRGPQGTLSGEGAEGGAMHYFTGRPDLANYESFGQFGLESTQHGSLGSRIGGAIGGPLIGEKFGARIGAWTEREGGYVDRVDHETLAVTAADSNWTRRDAFAASLAIEPIKGLRITPAWRHQVQFQHDTSAFFVTSPIFPVFSHPQQGVLLNGRQTQQPYSDRLDLLSLDIAAEIGGLALSGTSGHVSRAARAYWEWDATGGWGIDELRQKTTVHQLELWSRDAHQRVRWLAGALYTRTNYDEAQSVASAYLTDNGHVNGHLVRALTTESLAAYVRSDLRLSNQLTAALGVRTESFRDAVRQTIFQGQLWQFTREHADSDRNRALAPQVELVFTATNGDTIFLRGARGFRAGGLNVMSPPLCSEETPPAYRPDSLTSVELGASNSWFGSRLHTQVNVFHMNWRNIQTPIPVDVETCGFGYIQNLGTARSDGFDLDADLQLTSRLHFHVTAAYADPHRTRTVTARGKVVASAGDVLGALPGVPVPWSASAQVDYAYPTRDGVVLRLQLRDIYRSQNHGPFSVWNPDALVYDTKRLPDPAYTQLDVRLSAGWPRIDLTAYMKNVLNSAPTLQLRNSGVFADTLFATTLRPRTVGLQLDWRLQATRQH